MDPFRRGWNFKTERELTLKRYADSADQRGFRITSPLGPSPGLFVSFCPGRIGRRRMKLFGRSPETFPRSDCAPSLSAPLAGPFVSRLPADRIFRSTSKSLVPRVSRRRRTPVAQAVPLNVIKDTRRAETMGASRCAITGSGVGKVFQTRRQTRGAIKCNANGSFNDAAQPRSRLVPRCCASDARYCNPRDSSGRGSLLIATSSDEGGHL